MRQITGEVDCTMYSRPWVLARNQTLFSMLDQHMQPKAPVARDPSDRFVEFSVKAEPVCVTPGTLLTPTRLSQMRGMLTRGVWTDRTPRGVQSLHPLVFEQISQIPFQTEYVQGA